jgi:hypothetical protein
MYEYKIKNLEPFVPTDVHSQKLGQFRSHIFVIHVLTLQQSNMVGLKIHHLYMHFPLKQIKPSFKGDFTASHFELPEGISN